MFLGQMTCEIDLADKYLLGGVHSISKKESIHQIVQTAKVSLPASVIMKNNDKREVIKLADKIKEGDTIKIAFGYSLTPGPSPGGEGRMRTEFEGYIKSIDRKIPVEIECEDAMYLFRKTNVKKSFTNQNIKEVLSYLISEVKKAHGVNISLSDKIPAIKVQNFIANNQTALFVIQQLIDWYPMLSIRLVNGTLVCGLTYQVDDIQTRVKYALNGDKNNTVSVDELKYNTEVKTAKVVWEITKEDGKVEKKQFGDNNAELVINKKVSGKVGDDVLKKMADNEMVKNNYVGFKGSFTTFLFPACEEGVIAEIDDPQFGRKGNYFIGTVETTFDTSGGGRRKLEVDFKMK